MEDAYLSAIGCDTMDRTIVLTVIYPLAFNIRVCRVFTDDENEGSAYRLFVFYYIATSLLNIIHQLLSFGVAIAPLRRIAICSHLGSS